MKIPKKLKLGYKVYSIFLTNLVVEKNEDSSRELYGLIQHSERKIQILKTLSKHGQIETLTHELIHALLYNMGYVQDDQEYLCEGLTFGIIQAVQDNPWLVDLWKEKG